MKSLKRLLTVALSATLATAPAMAQGAGDNGLDYQPYPHMFVGLQGGAQTTFTNFDNSKLITPTASLSFGAWFTSVVGARLHVNGLWNKGGIHTSYDAKYSYKYVTTDLDLMVNLFTLFGQKDYYPLSVSLIGGIGLNTAWENDHALTLKSAMPLAWDGTRLSHNARIGAMLNYDICKNFAVNLEVAANSLSDRYNSKVASKDDWQVTAQLGVAYKFGFKKSEPVVLMDLIPEPEPIETWETVIDTTWYDDITYRDVVKEGDIDKRIFFNIAASDVESTDAQIEAVANFLKEVQNGEIIITSFADKGTGNPKKNMGYSKSRAEKTKKALIAKGVNPKMIKKVEWKGDTVQPYPDDNDKNRLSIITGHGIYKQQEEVVTRKFKTNERRVKKVLPPDPNEVERVRKANEEIIQKAKSIRSKLNEAQKEQMRKYDEYLAKIKR
ncbi:MAG: OmpA family protein [Bacteroidaceae bacterium]|nr:OmpA family protein [Bacteroidaceae bacterium]